ncbi:MAG: hypothetical protein ACOY31_06900 [Bacillota bacterium]
MLDRFKDKRAVMSTEMAIIIAMVSVIAVGMLAVLAPKIKGIIDRFIDAMA